MIFDERSVLHRVAVFVVLINKCPNKVKCPLGKLPWREAGPPHHHDDKVDSDQYVVNNELSLP